MKNVNMKIKNIFIDSWNIYKSNYIIMTQIMFIFLALFLFGLYVLNHWINFELLQKTLESGSQEQFILFVNNLEFNFPVHNLFLFLFAFYVFITGLFLGAVKISFLLQRGLPVKLDMFFSCFNQYLAVYLLGNILFNILISILQINLFIFQISLVLLSSFYPFIIIDQKIKNPIIALKNSFIMALNNISLTALTYFIIFISTITILLFTMGLGLIIILPFFLLCYTKLYLLIKNTQSV